MTRKRRPQRHPIAPYTQQREMPETNPQLATAILALPHLPCIWFRQEPRGAGGANQGLHAHTPDVSIVSSG
jgi:hypothetical protein